MPVSCEWITKMGDEPCGRPRHLLAVRSAAGDVRIACLAHLHLTWGRMCEPVIAEPVEPSMAGVNPVNK